MTERPEHPGSFLSRTVEGLLVLLPSAALLGPWVGVGGVFGYRILVVLLAGCALTGWIRPVQVRRFSCAACAIVIIAVAWAVIGTVGAIRLGTSRDLSSLMGAGLALAGAWSVARLMSDGYLRRERALRGVAIGWAVAVWMGVPLAVWEILAARHLGTYTDGAWRNHLGLYRQPATWLTNPNLYAVFLAVGSLWVGVIGVRSAARWVRIAAVVTTAVGLGLLFATDGRVVYAALLLAVLVRLWAVRRWRWVLLGVVVGGAVVIVVTHLPQAELTWHRFIGVVTHHNNEGPSSFAVRTTLLAWGLALVVDHPLLGAGPGGYRASILAMPRRWFPHGKTDPHNGVLEIASQYGLVVTALLAVCWCVAIGRCWRLRRWWGAAFITAMPLLSLANSTYLVQSVSQLGWLVCVLVASLSRQETRRS